MVAALALLQAAIAVLIPVLIIVLVLIVIASVGNDRQEKPPT